MIDKTANVGNGVSLGNNVRIWAYSHIRENAIIGENSIIGEGVYIGAGVFIGANCKIQNNCLIYEPAKLSDGVFVGPGVIFTNDQYPRAVNTDGTIKSSSDWLPVGVKVHPGASIGAGAICVAPVEIGKWSMVAAGAVVTKDVEAHELVAGTPARRIGWVSRHGVRLVEDETGTLVCPVSGDKYHLLNEGLTLID